MGSIVQTVPPEQEVVHYMWGAEGVLPSGYIEGLLRVFKQFTYT